MKLINAAVYSIVSFTSHNCSHSIPSDSEKKSKVILVHGIFDDSTKMEFLKNKLTARGYQCIAPSLTPKNAKHGIAPLAQQLDSYIKENNKEGETYHLIGYSLGGIISRYYLANCDNTESCISLTTLASPNHGTVLAKLYPYQSGIELRPNSTFLNKLNCDSNSTHESTLSIRTTLDGIIIPSKSSYLPNAKNITIHTPTHISIVLSNQVVKYVTTHMENSEK